MTDHTARREDARQADGQFGEQQHSAPEAALNALPDFRSARARLLDAQLTEHRKKRDDIMEMRREEHLLDIARQLPANVTRITFRVDHDRDGQPQFLMFDHAEDDTDMVDLHPSLTDHLYGVAADFGSPGDFEADNWMDGEDGYYWVDLDEETALQHASSFREVMKAAQRTGGTSPLHTGDGHAAWTERAMRVRAHHAGVTAIHFDMPEDAAGVRVVGFDLVDRGTIAPDDSDGDHMFLVGQGQRFAHRTDSMTRATAPGAHLTMKV